MYVSDFGLFEQSFDLFFIVIVVEFRQGLSSYSLTVCFFDFFVKVVSYDVKSFKRT